MSYFEKHNTSLIFRNNGETVEVSPWGENSLRVRASVFGGIKDGEIALLSAEETEAVVMYQVGAMMSFAKAYNLEIEHVRPHGAMYQQAAEDFNFACAIAKAVKKCSQWLVYYGAAGEITQKVGEYVNIPVAQEIHLEKNYNTDGTIDFSRKDVENIFGSVNRLKNYLLTGQIDNLAGGRTEIEADTIHFSNKIANAEALIRQSRDLIVPVPVNYKNACKSGWVE